MATQNDYLLIVEDVPDILELLSATLHLQQPASFRSGPLHGHLQNQSRNGIVLDLDF